jgi:hypothetical protein
MSQKPVFNDNIIDFIKIFIIVSFIVLYVLNTGPHEL